MPSYPSPKSKCSSLLLALAIFAGAPVSFAKTTWDWELSSNQKSSASTQAQKVNFGGSGTLNLPLNESFELAAKGGLSMQTGSLHSTLDPDDPGSGLILDHAQLNLRPLSFIEFSGGALNQKMHQNTFLLSYRAFPAAQVSLLAGPENFRLQTYFQSAIPTSAQFASQTADREPLPNLHVGGAKLKIENGSSIDPDLKVSAVGARWKFEKLPSKVAANSILLGNTILQSSPGLAQFAYQFEGTTVSLESEFRIYRNFKGTFVGRGHRNDKAPVGANEARAFAGGFKFTTMGQTVVATEYGVFQNQSDAGPGYYNASSLGNNNAQGDFLNFLLDFKKSQFSIRTQYTRTKEIFDNPAQEDGQSLGFFLEINNANI